MIVIEKGIKVTYEDIATILRHRFPECSVNVEKTGGWRIANNLGGYLAVVMRKSCLVHVFVYIDTNEETGNTEITTTSGRFDGFVGMILNQILAGDIVEEVETALKKGLKKSIISDTTQLTKTKADLIFADTEKTFVEDGVDATEKKTSNNYGVPSVQTATVDNNPPVRKKKWGCFTILGIIVGALLLFVCIRFCYFKIRYSNDGYAILQDSTLTLYYGKNKPQGALSIYNTNFDNAMFYVGNFRYRGDTGWKGMKDKIKKVVFDSSFKGCKPVDCSSWFQDCKNLVEIIGMKEYLNTENVTDMHMMFFCCQKLTSVDVSGFKTDNVTNMWCMFDGCKNLTSLDLSNFNTSEVTDMGSMFDDCQNLTSLDLSNFNTSEVTNMHSMFFYCVELHTIYAGDGWNTNKVKGWRNEFMFGCCDNLVGGDGTECNREKDDASFARIDGGPSAPGYFTRKK